MRVSALVLAVVALVSGLQAQSWNTGQVYFVSPTGSNVNPGSTVAPWRNISFAVNAVRSTVLSGVPVTINVIGGNYSAPTGEAFPIQLPARGLAIEGYSGSVQVIGPFGTPVFQVNQPGVASGPGVPVPDSILSGLQISSSGGTGSVGIDIAPGSAATPSTPDAVQVRDCSITGARFGINSTTATPRRSQHVFERLTLNAGLVGIQLFGATGDASELLRANRISNYAWGGIVCTKGSGTKVVYPRVVSNLVEGCREGISIHGCSAWIVNNTCVNANSSGCNAFGVSYSGNAPDTLVLTNNISWNPNFTNSLCGTVDPQDILVSGTPNTTIAFNDTLDPPLPGNISILPGFVSGTDHHLSPLSPLIGAGSNVYVAPIQTLTVGSLTVRADNGSDLDADPRVLDFTRTGTAVVDIGCDEVTGTRMTIGGNANSLGNVIGGTTISITVTGTPASTVSTILWFPNGSGNAAQQNTLVQPLGNLLLDPASMLLGPTFTMPPSGTLMVLYSIPPGTLFEDEFYVQAQVSSGALGDYSNRVELELKQ